MAENPRKAIRASRERRLLVIQGPSRTIKVYAANETVQGVLRHPNGARFRAQLDRPVEWPNDNFTKRRIADGSVRTDGPGSGAATVPDPTQNAREQAAAQKPKPADKPEPQRSRPTRTHQPQPSAE